MRQILVFFIAVFINLQLTAQVNSGDYSPLDFWEGTWILKNTEIDPPPPTDDWKSVIGVNEFVPILNGQGLHRIAKSGAQKNEAYMFYDKGSEKVYAFSIDPNGYVWETSASIDEDKDLIIFVGGAKNDPSASTQSVLKIMNENEVRFEQTVFQNGEKISFYKGQWLRVPDLD